MRFIGFLLLAAALLAGCSDGNGDAVLDMFGAVPSASPTSVPGTGTVTGTFGGESIQVRSAVSASLPINGGEVGVIILSDETEICDWFSDGYQPYGARHLVIQLLDWDGSTAEAPSSPGEYPVYTQPGSAQRQAFADYLRMSSSQCGFVENVPAADGSVTLDAVGGNVYRGSAALETDFAENVTVTFDTTSCPALTQLFGNGLPCQ